jgi:hypothetical protein
MAVSEADARDRVAIEPSEHWLDSAVICSALGAGMLIGMYVGGVLGGHAAEWLGMGVGGAFLGGLGCYADFSFRPHVGHPRAALRIVVLLLLTGAYGYLAEGH